MRWCKTFSRKRPLQEALHPRRFTLKTLLTLCAILMVMVTVGCPGGSMGSQNEQPAAASNTMAASTTEPAAATPDVTSNGGSSLTASSPYKSTSAPAQQNVNPTPFLVATQPAGKTFTPPSELISRADGTMMGPNDQMAAGTGPGGQGMSDMVPHKTTPAPAKPAAAKPAPAAGKAAPAPKK
jgi:pyruvate/2-oxoglutarate dehydrogenase complex dihydrolipoamide acyltransferase (E2) component